jgi:hypothetical protein
MPMDG